MNLLLNRELTITDVNKSMLDYNYLKFILESYGCEYISPNNSDIESHIHFTFNKKHYYIWFDSVRKKYEVIHRLIRTITSRSNKILNNPFTTDFKRRRLYYSVIQTQLIFTSFGVSKEVDDPRSDKLIIKLDAYREYSIISPFIETTATQIAEDISFDIIIRE